MVLARSALDMASCRAHHVSSLAVDSEARVEARTEPGESTERSTSDRGNT